MNIPDHLMYTTSHEWVELLPRGGARFGITDYAQSQLGDIVYISLPEEGGHVKAGDKLADVESVKAVTDVYSPLTGVITDVNAALEDAPERMNAAPYEAWICEIGTAGGADMLIDAITYRALIEAE